MNQSHSVQCTLTNKLSKSAIQPPKLNQNLLRQSAKQPNPAYEIYIQSLALSGRKSMASMLQQSCRLLGWKGAAGYYPWQDIGYRQMQQIKASMLSQEYSLNSINLTLAGLRGVAKAAFNLEMISAEQLMRIQAVTLVKGTVLTKGRSLEKQEIKALIKACDHSRTKIKSKRDKAIILLCCGCGLRCAELISLQIEDFDKKQGVIIVRYGKGRKQRELYPSSMVIKALIEWCNELGDTSGPVFREIRKNGQVGTKAISKEGIAKMLRKQQLQSGLKVFSPHDLRRTFVTQLLVDGVDINLASQLAGHSSITTTSLYDKRGKEALKCVSKAIRL